MNWRPCLLLVVLALAAGPAHAAEPPTEIPRPTLMPGPALPMTAPYAVALLKLENTTPHEIVAIRMRWRGGGPTMLLSAVASPNQSADLTVILPPIAASQVYDIGLVDRNGTIVATAVADITWPAALVQREAFLDPQAYATAAAEDYPAWPRRLKRLALLGAGIYVVILLGAALLPQPHLRSLAVMLTLVAATVAITWREHPVVVEDVDAQSVILRTRRTTELELPPPQDGLLIPVYRSPVQMEQDDLAITPGRGGAMTLKPTDIRIFRRRPAATAP